MIGILMAIIDSSIVNVALDTMGGNLGASTDEIAWVATAYILASVIVMPLNGYLTGALGRKKFYAGCVALFTVTSFLCGTASNVWQLVFYRVLQGIGGGALQPTAQSILFESYPPEKRGQAMAIFGIGAMVGPAIGPTLGGYIVDNASWPLIFFINVPIGILAFFMTLAYIRDPSYIKKPERGPDWIALALMTFGLASLQYVLERGQHDDWFSSQGIIVLTIVAFVGIIGFIVRELVDKNPLVDLSVFRVRSFAAGNVIGIVTGFGLFGLNLILPLFFQTVLGFTAWQAGVALLPGAVATMLGMPIAGRLVNRADPRLIIGAGMLAFGISCWWLGTLNQYSGFWDIFWPRSLQGFSIGFLFVPLATSSLGDIPRSEMANATGLFTLVRQLGGSLGIALLTTLLERHSAIVRTALVGGITQANPAVQQLLTAPATAGHALANLMQIVALNAQMITYSYLFQLSAIVFFVSIPTVFLLAGRPKKAAMAEAAAIEL